MSETCGLVGLRIGGVISSDAISIYAGISLDAVSIFAAGEHLDGVSHKYMAAAPAVGFSVGSFRAIAVLRSMPHRHGSLFLALGHVLEPTQGHGQPI